MNHHIQTSDSLILIGFASCGKTTIGRLAAAQLQVDFCDLDLEIESRLRKKQGTTLTCRQIYTNYGRDFFLDLEAESLSQFAGNNVILATGGGAPLPERNQVVLKKLGKIIYLQADPAALLERMQIKGLPASLVDAPTVARFMDCVKERHAVYAELADAIIATTGKEIQTVTSEVVTLYEQYNRHII